MALAKLDVQASQSAERCRGHVQGRPGQQHDGRERSIAMLGTQTSMETKVEGQELR